MQDQDTSPPPGEEQLTVDQLTVREQLSIAYVQGLIYLVKLDKASPEIFDRVERLLELDAAPLDPSTRVLQSEQSEEMCEAARCREIVDGAGLSSYVFLDDAVGKLVEDRDAARAEVTQLTAALEQALQLRVADAASSDAVAEAAYPMTGPRRGRINRDSILRFITASAATGGVTNAAIRTATSLTREVVDRHLRTLVAEGEIYQHKPSSGAASTYTLPAGHAEPAVDPTPAKPAPATTAPPTSSPTSPEPSAPDASEHAFESPAPSREAAAANEPPNSAPTAPTSSPKPSSQTPDETPDDTRPTACPECGARLVYASPHVDRESDAACLGGRDPGGTIHRWVWNGLGQLRLIPTPVAAPEPAAPAASTRPVNDQKILDALRAHGEMPQAAAGRAAGVPKGSLGAIFKRLHAAGEIARREFAYTPGSGAGGHGVAWRLPGQPTRMQGNEVVELPAAAPPVAAEAESDRTVPAPEPDPSPAAGLPDAADELEDDDGVPDEDEAPLIGVEITQPRAKAKPKPPAISRRVQKLLEREPATPPGAMNLNPNLSTREQQIITYLRRNGGRVHVRNIAVSLVAKVADVGTDLRRLIALDLVEQAGDSQFQAARPKEAT